MAGEIADDRAALRRLINGYQVSQALHAIVSLGVPDALAGGPRSLDELASETGSDADALYRVLRAVAAIGVLEERPGRAFGLTPLGEGLRSDSPMSLAGWATQIGRPYYWEAWAHLVDSVRTGENAFRIAHGTDVWTFRSTRPEELATFNRAMASLSGTAAEAVVDAYDFGRFDKVVDVGGAQGTLLAAILARNPRTEGVLFDQPHVVAGAEQLLNQAGVGLRCQIAAGSFFEAVPEGGDAYVLKSVLHDWTDVEATEILRTCLRAMSSSAVLLIVEPVVGEPNEGADVKFSDLNMLVAPGGRERTREEWQSLLSGAGLVLQGVVPTRGPMCVIEAVADSER
jgi:hypothetical protein